MDTPETGETANETSKSTENNQTRKTKRGVFDFMHEKTPGQKNNYPRRTVDHDHDRTKIRPITRLG